MKLLNWFGQLRVCLRRIFLLAFFVFVIFFICKIKFVKIVGFSMFPTVSNADICLLYRTNEIERGDVVVVDMGDVLYVKRAIGISGDKLLLTSYATYVNGIDINEVYVMLPDHDQKTRFIELSTDQIWVMGDNRAASNDSRYFGPINKKDIIGKIIVKCWNCP